MTGVTHLQGHFLGLDEPVVPLLPNSDYQTGIVRLASADKINSGNYRANGYSILSILAYVTGEYGDQAVRQGQLDLLEKGVGTYTTSTGAMALNRDKASDIMNSCMVRVIAAVRRLENLISKVCSLPCLHHLACFQLEYVRYDPSNSRFYKGPHRQPSQAPSSPTRPTRASLFFFLRRRAYAPPRPELGPIPVRWCGRLRPGSFTTAAGQGRIVMVKDRGSVYCERQGRGGGAGTGRRTDRSQDRPGEYHVAVSITVKC